MCQNCVTLAGLCVPLLFVAARCLPPMSRYHDVPQGDHLHYVYDYDKVWVSHFTANAILKFDPESETFESFPSDRPVLRSARCLGAPVRLGVAESGTDRLVVIRNNGKEARD